MSKSRVEIQIECLREMYKLDLERRLESTIKILERELKSLREDENYRPNGCGILQNEANNIDDLAIKLGVLNAVDGKN